MDYSLICDRFLLKMSGPRVRNGLTHFWYCHLDTTVTVNVTDSRKKQFDEQVLERNTDETVSTSNR